MANAKALVLEDIKDFKWPRWRWWWWQRTALAIPVAQWLHALFISLDVAARRRRGASPIVRGRTSVRNIRHELLAGCTRAKTAATFRPIQRVAARHGVANRLAQP